MKSRSLWSLILLILVAALVLSACGTTAAPPATEKAPAATEEPAATEVPAPPEAPAEPVTISVWHGYTETEEQVFSNFVESFKTNHPEVTVEVLAVPFEELQNKFQTEASAGGGPTLITGPQDRMAGYAEAGLLAEIPTDAAFFSELVPAAVEGGKVSGAQVGVPINNKVVALYYNKSMVDTPPATFEDLLAAAADGKGLAITGDWFHNYMWLPAYGAALFDDNYKCVADQAGGADALQFLADTCKAPGVSCDSNDGNQDTQFRQKEVAFRIQGPWASGDFIKDLGAENVGVVRVPPIAGAGDPRPWNQSEMISVNINADDAQKDAALMFIGELVRAETQAAFLNEANWIPSNSSVDVSANPVVGGFLEQVPFSDPFPVVAELGATWEPMGNAITAVLEGVKTPQDALTEACTLVNTTNEK